VYTYCCAWLYLSGKTLLEKRTWYTITLRCTHAHTHARTHATTVTFVRVLSYSRNVNVSVPICVENGRSVEYVICSRARNAEHDIAWRTHRGEEPAANVSRKNATRRYESLFSSGHSSSSPSPFPTIHLWWLLPRVYNITDMFNAPTKRPPARPVDLWNLLHFVYLYRLSPGDLLRVWLPYCTIEITRI